MTDNKNTDRVATPEEAEELKIMQLRDRFFKPFSPEQEEERKQRLAQAEKRHAEKQVAKLARKAYRRYWRTANDAAKWIEEMPMNERRAWIEWFTAKFLKGSTPNV